MNILPQNNRGAEGQTASLTRTAGTDVLTTWKNFKSFRGTRAKNI